MRIYKRKYSDVPHDVFMQVRYKLSGYDRLKAKKQTLLQCSNGPQNGMPRGSDISKPTENKAVELAYIENELEVMDQSCVIIRGEYSGKVYDDFNPIKAYWSYDYFNYMHIRNSEDDEGPSMRTWNNYKSYFTKIIAQKLNIF